MAQITFKSTLPDATLEKIALFHGWKSKVANPAYDPEQTLEPEFIANPDYDANDPNSAETIPNPNYDVNAVLEPEEIDNPETAINFAALHVLGRACAEIGVHESTIIDKEDMTPKAYEAKKVEIRTAIYTTTIVEVNDVKIN